MQRKNISLDEIMVRQLITVDPSDTIESIVQVFLEKKISGAPVVDNGKLVGVISEKDVMAMYVDSVYNGMPAGCAKGYMSTAVQTLKTTDTVLDASRAFIKSNYRRFPVVDADGNLVGQVSRRDVLVVIQTYLTNRISTPAPNAVEQ